MGTQKNRLDETVLLSSQNTCLFKLMEKKIIAILRKLYLLNWPYKLKLLRTRNALTDTMANSEDPVEIPHNVAFHQSLHFLLRTKSIFRERNTFFGGGGTPQYKQWTILTVLYVALWKIPLVLNGL